MEFIGKTIKKESKGFGVVNSYDPSSKLFEILYKDGSFEQLGFSGITSFFEQPDSVTITGNKKKPISGEVFFNLNNCYNSNDSGSRSMNPCSSTSIDDDRLNLNEDAVRDLDGGFDLNVGDGFSNGVDDEISLLVNCDEEEEEGKKMRRTSVCNIDLNVDANGEFEESSTKMECGFDLNMGLLDEEEVKGLDEMNKVEDGKNGTPEVGSDSKDAEEVSFDAKIETLTHSEADKTCSSVEGVLCSNEKSNTISSMVGSKGGVFPGVLGSNGFTSIEDQLKACTTTTVHDNEDSSAMERKVKKRKRLVNSGNSVVETTLRRSRRRLATGGGSSVGIVENVRDGVCEGLKGGATLGDVDSNDLMDSDNGTPLNHDYQGSTIKRRKRRKKLEPLDNGSSCIETLSRRTSSRIVSSLSANSETLSSAAVSIRLTKTFTTTGCQQLEECSAFPPKLNLPPSSEKLDLDGIPVLDLFSVYTCLRSFSTMLFLSPFDLEDLVAALKCDSANTLLDSIHVSLLQTLRKQMVLLSEENILSASNCLRNLNWDLLDSITWPIFMLDYMLIHGSALKADIDLPKLKLFESEYYKQTAVVKIEMLRCLCDDVIEVEAIKSELNRRTLGTYLNIDIDRNLKTEIPKRRRTSTDVLGGSCLTKEAADETADWNSDECCLCKMDGSLICCDGCPAAYHMKCVGVSNNSLPDGDWYCPECLIDKDKPWLRMGKSLRGAEIVGVDPYGRVFYLSAGYLLVLDTCDSESSCHHYHINDLTAVIEALKSSGSLYEPILDAISKHLNIYVNSNESKSNADSANLAVSMELMKEQTSITCMLQPSVAPSESCSRDVTSDIRKPDENFVAAQYSSSMECDHLDNSMKMENLLTSFEGTFETSQAPGSKNSKIAGSDVMKKSVASSNDSGTSCTNLTIRDISLTSADLYENLGNNIQPSPMTMVRQGEVLQGQSRIGYVNCYSFARTSSMVVEELTRRSVDKVTASSTKPYEDIISSQLKAIIKTSTKFVWPIFQNVSTNARKEKCGWCFPCRAKDTDDSCRDCLFNLNVSNSQDFDNEIAGPFLQKSIEGHLVVVLRYILYMEDRLHGLLLGLWLNPHFTKLWRESVAKASDVATLKYFLLMLEANLNPLVLAPEWNKHVDSVTTMGSASHIVTSSSRVSSKHGVDRKRARCSDVDPKPSLNAASGLGLLWWRGGKVSRGLFNWKALPRALASKAARQAGCTKVAGVLYPDSSDFTKRNRLVVWKAAVEASKNVEQIALQVRELDANIRWDDIENTHLLSKMDQSKKIVRSFKKVIIRRKFTEGTVVKYLLDFGKRRFIPDVVITHGSLEEESSSERRKYWLEDTFVPLHLLKAFEERRIARKSNKMNPGKHHRSNLLTKRCSKRKGLPYLFAKAEQPKYYQCGHCYKNVLIREALSCLHCKGFFHKKHVKRSPGAAAAECMYSCHKCQSGNLEKSETKWGKKIVLSKSKNSLVGSRVLRSKAKRKVRKDVKTTQKWKNKKKDALVLPLRRSPRKLKCVAVQNKKVGKRKKGKGKGKQIKSTRKTTRQSKKSTWQKKRTQAYNAYWLNGIRFSRKPHDERGVLFKGKSLVTPSSLTSVSMVSPPKCSLSCEKEFTSSLSYVCCEICGDWFHGDAFGLTIEKMDSIIGFRCHKCRAKISPICPHLHKETKKEESGEANICDRDKKLKDSFFRDQSSYKDQELGDISSSIANSISCQSSVENIRFTRLRRAKMRSS